jgi:phosphopantothenoylcysteine decarboxylase/phosphopantothenate--cysteine ligase
MLQNKKILLAVTGSIAAYKSASLVRLLIKAGAEVRILMTPSAKDFISPLTLGTLSKNKVLIDMFHEDSWSNHVMLGRWADVMLIAPLSCNTLSKMAHGQCDNLVLAVYLSATCPVIVAPAMDEDMWHHPSTKKNIELISSYGNHIIPVGKGELASGLLGDGRMAEPEAIVEYLSFFFQQKNDLAGKKVLITAGPTYEPIDPVRFVGNHSTGKMGVALAQEMKSRGAIVTLVLGPTDLSFDLSGIEVQRVKTAAEMYEVCINRFEEADIAVMSAAVADYTPVETATEKIKKANGHLTLELTKTKDILRSLGEVKKKQILVGFALETHHEKENALKKLNEKNADLIVLNSLQDAGAGFGSDTNKITVFEKGNIEHSFELKSKKAVAKDIVNLIADKLHEK